jgi:hypothetical protein
MEGCAKLWPPKYNTPQQMPFAQIWSPYLHKGDPPKKYIYIYIYIYKNNGDNASTKIAKQIIFHAMNKFIACLNLRKIDWGHTKEQAT